MGGGGVEPPFKHRPLAGKRVLGNHLGFSYLRTLSPPLIISATPLRTTHNQYYIDYSLKVIEL